MGRVGVDGRLTGFFPFSLHIGACPRCEEDEAAIALSELVLLMPQIGSHAESAF